MLTIAVFAFTLAMVVIKVDEVVSMTEPNIQSFPRQLTKEQRENIGDISWSDVRFNIGLFIEVTDLDGR